MKPCCLDSSETFPSKEAGPGAARRCVCARPTADGSVLGRSDGHLGHLVPAQRDPGHRRACVHAAMARGVARHCRVVAARPLASAAAGSRRARIALRMQAGTRPGGAGGSTGMGGGAGTFGLDMHLAACARGTALGSHRDAVAVGSPRRSAPCRDCVSTCADRSIGLARGRLPIDRWQPARVAWPTRASTCVHRSRNSNHCA